jgi:hypothetical protein
MRRAFCLVAPLLVIGYLYAQWSDWFSRVELETVGKRPLVSDPINLAKVGPIEWIVPKEEWVFKNGEADLELSMNLHLLQQIPSGRDQIDLRVKVRAEGRVSGGEWQDQSVRDWYFKTDEPFSKEGSSLWVQGGRGRLEYGMARVRVSSQEELRIVIQVLVPDEQLQWGMPRLKLVPKHDGAKLGVSMIFLYLLREKGYWASICLVILLAWFSWPLKPKP